ncbi:hypothetical protein [Endozoicomonas elysicola]|uniref:Uncharacterized protein n=1 Tax=Endozoicomonas elysicola TaxID=305900 RepID=A0A081K7U1_9GAMM|nr:hypothetical protein [Endozoicomonas elysicola]KEI70217.1 hypothetical protein GV64_05180 [Endozoicomonas elysicola]
MPAIEVHSAPITSEGPLSSPSLFQSGQKKNQEASWLSRSVSVVIAVFCKIGRAIAYTAKALYDFLIFAAITPYKYIYQCLASPFNDKKQQDSVGINIPTSAQTTPEGRTSTTISEPKTLQTTPPAQQNKSHFHHASLINKTPFLLDTNHPLNESLNRDGLKIQWPHIMLWEDGFHIEVFTEENARYEVALFNKLDASQACELKNHRCAIYYDQLVDACSDIGICICKDDYPTALTRMSLIVDPKTRDIRSSGR